MLDITRKKDDEWNDILKDLGIKIDYPIKKTGNFKEDYLSSIKEIIKNIRNNKYLETLEKEDRQELIELLDSLANMFWCFRYRMCDYTEAVNTSDDDLNLIPKWYLKSGKFSSIPCSHNFSKYLGNMTPVLYDKYYKIMVDIIDEFINNNGDILPTYLYELEEYNQNFIIKKLRLFSKEDVKIDHSSYKNLRLPNYYEVNFQKKGTLEDYQKIYQKCLGENHWEECFLRFKDEEYPVLEWIQENSHEDYDVTFYKNWKYKDEKWNICHYLDVYNKDIINVKDISYVLGMKINEVVTILEDMGKEKINDFEYKN